MTELEKIEYAKSFIDKLANGINPLDDTPIPDDDIANNVRLSRCFFYVSSMFPDGRGRGNRTRFADLGELRQKISCNISLRRSSTLYY